MEDKELIEEWRKKAQLWDALGEEIGNYYDTPSDKSTRESDLLIVGEKASKAFGWMHLYESKK